MDKFKPEDDLIPDPDDRQSGRSRKQDTFDNEPQLNVDDINIDIDDRRVSKSKRVREDEDDTYDAVDDEEMAADARPPRGRKKAARQKTPITRQYLMMGTGILVLLLLIFGIGSALKAPSPSSDTTEPSPGAERNIDLSAANGGNTTTPPTETATASQSQDLSIPPISSTPTQAPSIPQPEGQQRIELQGNLSDSLVQQESQITNATTRSTLPMEPATVAPVPGSKTAETRSERKTAVIEPVQKAPTRTHAAAQREKPVVAKRTEPTPVATAPAKAAPVPQPAPAAKAPVVAAQTKPTAPAASSASQGNTQSLKNASSGSYTLQLNASSNSANLNAWAKKQNLQNYVVYQTSRNGQPWYVMVSGIYPTKADAERAVASLPAGVQSNKPWTKPIRQVQSELK